MTKKFEIKNFVLFELHEVLCLVLENEFKKLCSDWEEKYVKNYIDDSYLKYDKLQDFDLSNLLELLLRNLNNLKNVGDLSDKKQFLKSLIFEIKRIRNKYAHQSNSINNRVDLMLEFRECDTVFWFCEQINSSVEILEKINSCRNEILTKLHASTFPDHYNEIKNKELRITILENELYKNKYNHEDRDLRMIAEDDRKYIEISENRKPITNNSGWGSGLDIMKWAVWHASSEFSEIFGKLEIIAQFFKINTEDYCEEKEDSFEKLYDRIFRDIFKIKCDHIQLLNDIINIINSHKKSSGNLIEMIRESKVGIPEDFFLEWLEYLNDLNFYSISSLAYESKLEELVGKYDIDKNEVAIDVLDGCGEDYIIKRDVAEINADNFVFASKNRNKYHKKECEYSTYIKISDSIVFTSIMDAEKNGYRACRACCP